MNPAHHRPTSYRAQLGWFDDPAIGDRDNPVKNSDGSTTLYFGPELPGGAPASNYVHIPDSVNWFSLLRLYAPEEAVFNGDWVPGDFEKTDCE